eukprot:Skav214932  [mRNA]  locus=scaffold3017:46852:51085:- [translate_table: standard]
MGPRPVDPDSTWWESITAAETSFSYQRQAIGGKSGGKGKTGKGKPQAPPAEQPPWLASTSNVPMPATSSSASAAEQQLAHWASIMRKQEQSLPPEVQALLHEQTWQQGQQATKSLHNAVTKYGTARKNLQNARVARTQFHQGWRTYLVESISRWQSYLEYFEKTDQQFIADVTKAHEHFQEAKDVMNKVKEEVASKDKESIEEISDDEMTADRTVDPQATLVQDLSMMVDTLRQLKAKSDAALEPLSKRARTEKSGEIKSDDFGSTFEKSYEQFGLHHLKRSHSVVSNSDFSGEWSAIDKALDLQGEIHGSWIVGHASDFAVLRHNRDKKKVRFAQSDSIRIGPEGSSWMLGIHVPHGMLAHWDDKPWTLIPKADSVVAGDWDAAFPFQPGDMQCSHFGSEVPSITSSPFHADPLSHGAVCISERNADMNEAGNFDHFSLLAHQARPLPVAPREPAPVQPDVDVHHLGIPQDDADARQDEDEHFEEDESESMESDRHWQSVHIWQLGDEVHETRVRWDSFESLHRDICRVLRRGRRDVLNVYEVTHGPRDLVESDIVAVLVHNRGDIYPGEQRKFTLIDVQFHDAPPALHYKVVRTIKLLPSRLPTKTYLKRWRDGDLEAELDQVPTQRIRLGYEDDSTSLLQLTKQQGSPMVRLDDTPQCRLDDEEPSQSWTSSLADAFTGEIINVDDDDPEEPTAMIRRLGRANGLDILQGDDAAIGPADDFGRTSWTTWFLSGATVPRCDHPRLVPVHVDPGAWTRSFRRAWRDLIDPDEPIDWHIVQPEPTRDHAQPSLGHVIITQWLRPEQRAYHITTTWDGQTLAMAAFLGLEFVNWMDLISAAGEQERGLRRQLTYSCSVRTGPIELTVSTRQPGFNGLGFQVCLGLRTQALETETHVDIAIGPSMFWPPEGMSRAEEQLRLVYDMLVHHRTPSIMGPGLSAGDGLRPDRRGVLLTARFGDETTHQAVSALHQLTPEMIIWYVGGFDRCSPARDGWDCEVRFGSQHLLPSRPVQAERGYSFVVDGTLRHDESIAASTFDLEEDEVSRLQKPPPTKMTAIDFTEPIRAYEWFDTHLWLPCFDVEEGLLHDAGSREWVSLPWYQPGTSFDELWLYCDGSFCAANGRAGLGTAAFVRLADQWYFAGCIYAPIEVSDAYVAELHASLVAHKFIFDLLKMAGPTAAPPSVFVGFDAITVGSQADGSWAANRHIRLVHTLRNIVRICQLRFDMYVQGVHIKGHRGHPGNELVDALAFAATRQGLS